MRDLSQLAGGTQTAELMESGEDTRANAVIGESTGARAAWRGLPRRERLRISGLAG